MTTKCSLTPSPPISALPAPNMTKDEHKATIVTQLQQQNLNLLVDSLAAALAEIETLKAAADKPAP